MAPEHRENGDTEEDIQWALPEAPITIKRPVAIEADKFIPKPGIARANKAVSTERPHGADSSPDRLVIQQHIDFWDADHDGIIYPLDTFRGFHKIGFNWFLSFIAIFVIHGTFSWWSSDSWIPSPRFPIYIKNSFKLKHGSDSGTFDTEGRYVPQHFEDNFAKYAKKQKDALTLREVVNMIIGNRNIMDPVGWTAAALEWGALYYIAHNEQGFLTKERVRANYDGTLWYTLARENEARKKAAKEKRAHQKKAHHAQKKVSH
jgi:peroxygenase